MLLTTVPSNFTGQPVAISSSTASLSGNRRQRWRGMAFPNHW